MNLAHVHCVSDSGPHLVVDLVRQAQVPWSSLLLPSLSFFIFSTRQMTSLMPIKLSKASIFDSFYPNLPNAYEREGQYLELRKNK
jgi:hypothetical protein